MYVDLLDTNNFISINLSLVKLFGLSGAAYCSEIFSILKKAISKDKLVEDCCIRVDREYITDRLGLSEQDQLDLETRFSINGFISKSDKENNVFSVNVPLFVQIISGVDKLTNEEFNKLKKKLKPKKEKDPEEKRKGICVALKEGIVCSDLDIKDKLCEWVDTVCFTAKKPLTAKLVNTFVDTITSFTKEKAAVLRIIQIAITQQYRDPTWAINSYKKDLEKIKERERNTPRVTAQRRATSDDITGGEEF